MATDLGVEKNQGTACPIRKRPGYNAIYGRYKAPTCTNLCPRVHLTPHPQFKPSLGIRNSSANMKLLTILSTLLLSLSATVSAWTCLSDDDAQYIVNQSIIFLKHTNITQARAIAYDLFAPNLLEYGDSINALRQAPVCLDSFGIHFLCAYPIPLFVPSSLFEATRDQPVLHPIQP